MANERDCDVCIGGVEGEEVVGAKIRTLFSDGAVECDECELAIPKGQSYERVTGRCEGERLVHNTCELCRQIKRVFSCGEGMPMGCLWSEMEFTAFPRLKTSSPCFRQLSPDAKQFVLDRWNKWKFRPIGKDTHAKRS